MPKPKGKAKPKGKGKPKSKGKPKNKPNVNSKVKPAPIQNKKPLGVDVELVFSPPSQGGEGAAIVTYADNGKPTKRSHSVIDLMNAPTYAAKSFEVRASRQKIR